MLPPRLASNAVNRGRRGRSIQENTHGTCLAAAPAIIAAASSVEAAPAPEAASPAPLTEADLAKAAWAQAGLRGVLQPEEGEAGDAPPGLLNETLRSTHTVSAPPPPRLRGRRSGPGSGIRRTYSPPYSPS